MKKTITRALTLVLVSVLICGAWVGYDVVQNNKIDTSIAKDEYAKTLSNPINDIMIALEEGEIPDYSQIDETLKYIDLRYDTSDFRMPSIVRILYGHEEELPQLVSSEIKKTVLGFKYWMDQPGDDSMCYWSENHQLLFASSEYLLGHFYEDELFTNMNIKGEKHSEMGKERVLIWLEQRFLYGYTEWYSSTYYVEDMAPLTLLIDFAPDQEIRIKAAMVLDLMIYDLATQNYKGTFTANSGRMYESAKMSGTKGSMKEAISLIWPDYNQFLKVDDIGGLDAHFKYMKNYEVPEVLRSIGYDQLQTNVYKASTGINLSELAAEDLIGPNDPQIMMQLASEAFANPEVIDNTIKYMDDHQMFSNEFVSDLKLLNLGLIKTFNLGALVSTVIDPIYNGTAIQRANTYMYRTPDYAMSSAQAYHPGTYGDQHSLFSLNMNNTFNVFIQHPAASLSEGGALGSSPNYWVGNGYHPHTVQDKNINLSIFILPDKENMLATLTGMSREIESYTHAYFPKQYCDEVVISDQYAFGKLNDVYVALIGKNSLAYKTIDHTEYDTKKGLSMNYDLIQEGLESFWITEVASKDDYPSFDKFMEAIKGRPIVYENQTLTYKNLGLTYKGDFKVNGEVMDLEYDRFESAYSDTNRKASVISFELEDQSLYLDFNRLIRQVND